MTAAVWPPIPPDQLFREEEDSLAKELQWLLSSLQDTLQSLKAGLDECAALLVPSSGDGKATSNAAGGGVGASNSSTLVLSSFRSEAVKGFVTRVGTRIVKGDISLRLSSISLPRGQQSYKLAINPPQANSSTTTTTASTTISPASDPPPLILPQLVQARTHINSALDALDAARWAGDTHDAGFIAGQFRLLQEHLSDAREALRGAPEMEEEWWRDAVDVDTFSPPLPQKIAFHLFIRDAELVLQLRTLEPELANNLSSNNNNSNNNSNNNNNNNADPSSTHSNDTSSNTTSSSTLTSFTSFKDQLAFALGGVGLRSGVSGSASSSNHNNNNNNNNNNNSNNSNDNSTTGISNANNSKAQHSQRADGASNASNANNANNASNAGKASNTGIARNKNNVDSGAMGQAHSDGSYTYRGQRVRVRERMRVSNQDPALMAALAKLGALEHHVAVNRNSLEIVMGGGKGDCGDGDDDDDDDDDDDGDGGN